MSDEDNQRLREVQEYFGLPSVALVEKDLQVVRAIRVIAALDATPFDLVFGGGTALARAHRIVQRMSEDIDFKIVPRSTELTSRSLLNRSLSALRERLTAALLAAGFVFDPTDERFTKSRNESHYTIWHLPYASNTGAAQGLRPEIQIELTYAPMRLPPVTLPVSSFVTDATSARPDVVEMKCVSLNETAAEKLVALTRRTSMDLAGLTRGRADPTLVRHIYDLHMMRNHVISTKVAALAAQIAAMDARDFRHQYPAYETDPVGETIKALNSLRTDPTHQRRYDIFVAAMVYGDRPGYFDALETVNNLVVATQATLTAQVKT